ncbi:KfrB domain-containing protein, partial [Xanthomonas hyacinthi]|uniref:KfrB domain-containing protein n=1 Tax=Xanthomonas hyacinthi TaxID=56455 RepID=UPI003613F6F1
MKQRLLVMNGQRLVQSEQGGRWATDKVEKAGTIKPGIYNIHLSTKADKSQSHDGVIVHADKDHVYQQVGKHFVQHDRANFDKVPEIGAIPASNTMVTRRKLPRHPSSWGEVVPMK